MQGTADVFGLPTERPHLYETSGLGAAMSAAVGLDLCCGFEDGVLKNVQIAQAALREHQEDNQVSGFIAVGPI